MYDIHMYPYTVYTACEGHRSVSKADCDFILKSVFSDQ